MPRVIRLESYVSSGFYQMNTNWFDLVMIRIFLVFLGCRKKAILPIHQIPWVLALVKGWVPTGFGVSAVLPTSDTQNIPEKNYFYYYFTGATRFHSYIWFELARSDDPYWPWVMFLIYTWLDFLRKCSLYVSLIASLWSLDFFWC